MHVNEILDTLRGYPLSSSVVVETSGGDILTVEKVEADDEEVFAFAQDEEFLMNTGSIIRRISRLMGLRETHANAFFLVKLPGGKVEVVKEVKKGGYPADPGVIWPVLKLESMKD